MRKSTKSSTYSMSGNTTLLKYLEKIKENKSIMFRRNWGFFG
jgi:hypothetical protein